jgi:hypothetical protein
MNITRDDKKLLEKAVNFVLSDQYRGSSPCAGKSYKEIRRRRA